MASFSDKSVRAMEPPSKGRKVQFDDHRDAPTGFGLRVSPKGKRTFVLRYTNADGKDRLMSIGEHPTWSLAAARKRASELKRETDSGSDILEQRREKRAEQTVAHVVERFCRSHADKLKSAQAVRGVLENHLVPAIGEKKITDVRRPDVIAAVEAIAETRPRQGALLLTYTKQLFEWAENREIVEINPIASLKASKIDKGMTPRARARVLKEDEIVSLWSMTEPPEGMSRAALLALQFILVTGQRPGEVCQARQSDVQGRIWTIPAANRGKTDDDHVVPLTDTALALIEQAGGDEYLFEHRYQRAMGTGALSKAILRCSDALGMETGNRWRPHDLRRTMRTGLAAAGVSETIAETTIGHVRKGIAAVYDQHRYTAEKRAALESWERRLLWIANGQPAGDNVVSIAEHQA
ncbi:tyrosine-type recombinase/integrase [Salinisphaera orenii]|uniref:tyrosine-type recombinase/integrase n=1 Tax=Salinisphaera orenii TaxID=856731 RepID=UPI000DBE8A35